MLWYTEVSVFGQQAVKHFTAARLNVMYLSMSVRHSAAGGSLESTNLYFAPHINSTQHYTVSITPACRSVDVYFRGNYQINFYASLLLPLSCVNI